MAVKKIITVMSVLLYRCVSGLMTSYWVSKHVTLLWKRRMFSPWIKFS